MSGKLMRAAALTAALAAVPIPWARALAMSDEHRCLELHAAAHSNDVAMLEDVLIQGALIDCRDRLDGNATLLMHAAGGANMDVTKVLIVLAAGRPRAGQARPVTHPAPQ